MPNSVLPCQVIIWVRVESEIVYCFHYFEQKCICKIQISEHTIKQNKSRIEEKKGSTLWILEEEENEAISYIDIRYIDIRYTDIRYSDIRFKDIKTYRYKI